MKGLEELGTLAKHVRENADMLVAGQRLQRTACSVPAASPANAKWPVCPAAAEHNSYSQRRTQRRGSEIPQRRNLSKNIFGVHPD